MHHPVRRYRIGHRGAAGHAPENTLAAIKAGITAGVDLVELDVQVTRDSILVIMHDKRVDRTTNGSGYVSEMNLCEMRKLDAGDGEKVPTLVEVLDLARGNVGLMLEIISPGIAEQVLSAVQTSGFKEPVIYASFLHSELLQIRQSDPAALTLALLEGEPIDSTAFARDARVTHVGLGIDSLTSRFVESLHKESYLVFVYTVNDKRDVAVVKGMGVDGVISDFPEILES